MSHGNEGARVSGKESNATTPGGLKPEHVEAGPKVGAVKPEDYPTEIRKGLAMSWMRTK